MRYIAALFVLAALQAAASAQPGPTDQPPPGSTRATFISTNAMQWDVALGEQQPVCTTPCKLWIPPLAFVTMYSHEERPAQLDVGYLSGGDVVVAAKPAAKGELAAGVTFTTLTGLGLAAGVTLFAVGMGTDNTTMWKAGAITGIATAVGLYASIELIRHALPKASIGPARPYLAPNQVGLAGHF